MIRRTTSTATERVTSGLPRPPWPQAHCPLHLHRGPSLQGAEALKPDGQSVQLRGHWASQGPIRWWSWGGPSLELVRAELLERSERGVAKYQTTLARTDLTRAEWLRYLLE